MYGQDFRERARQLRREGKTYTEICEALGQKIPKATLVYWFRGIILPTAYHERVREMALAHLAKIRVTAHAAKAEARQIYLDGLRSKNSYLAERMEERDCAKIALAMLYLGEGKKAGNPARIEFGNSDPKVITLFLRLLNKCYTTESHKFRCTILCRADQDVGALEDFWQQITGIPRSLFYPTRADPRTIGKPTKKVSYRGVCVLDYFSAHVYNDLMQTIEVICGGR